jgi:molybdenum cofactor cytidylyltransferase
MTKLFRNIEIIILAAGNSSRLGQAKQFVKIDKESLLHRQCKLALNFTENITCVFGYQHQKMIDEIAHLPVNCIINEHWQQGLSSSIAKGVSSLATGTQAVMLLLVDQWQLNEDDLLLFFKQWQIDPNHIHTAIGQSNEVSVSGPPVIFPQQCFVHLSQLKQGNGAKSVIEQHAKILRTIHMPAAFIDLDTPEQLIVLQKYYK